MSHNIENTSFFRIVTWNNIRQDVLAVDAELAKKIDAINPNKDFKFIEASYAYGDLVINAGMVHLPTAKGTVSITSTELSAEVKELLSYNHIPLFLTLENDNEVFVDIHTRIVPLNLFHAGSLLGTFETADYLLGRKSTARWSVSAGSRSIFALPKINDNLGLKRLRSHYDFDNTLRTHGLSDHFHLFRAITNSKHFKQHWRNRVLFFSKKWLEETNNLELLALQKYFLKHAWFQASCIINRIGLGLQSEKFTEIISLRNLKPRPFIIDNARLLLYVIAGSLPAFRIVDNMQQYALPIKELQQSLIEIYRIETHHPTMMYICPLSDIKNFTVYYSLSYPTLLDGSPINPSTSTIILDLKEIKFLLDTLQRRGQNNDFIQYIINNIEIEYFHTEQDKEKEIKLSNQIPSEDNSFILKNANNLGFCYSSKFWKGCIRIRFK